MSATPRLSRLDRSVVERGLALSRTRAQGLIREGKVSVDGVVTRRVAAPVSSDQRVELDAAAATQWVGRGAEKLDGALQRWADDATSSGDAGAQRCLEVADRRCIDVGASTGGFTQVLLARGAASVVALDVGHDQLAAELRDDPRVREESGRTVRGIRADQIGGPFDLLVADLSFISLQLVMEDLAGLLRPSADAVLLVKPQFEVGRGRVGRGGVVRDPVVIADCLKAVSRSAARAGLEPRDVLPSTIAGREGNQEYLLWASAIHAMPTAAAPDSLEIIDRTITAAVADSRSPASDAR